MAPLSLGSFCCFEFFSDQQDEPTNSGKQQETLETNVLFNQQTVENNSGTKQTVKTRKQLNSGKKNEKP